MSPSKVPQSSELTGKEPKRPPGILHDILTAPAKEHGSKTAIVCMHQPGNLYAAVSKANNQDGCLRWTFNEVIHVGHQMAIALVEAGVKPGMMIAAFVSNGIECHILTRAAFELNCPIAMINPASTRYDKEIKHYFDMVKPSIVMASDASIADRITKAVPEAIEKSAVKLVCSGDKETNSWRSFGDLLESGSGQTKVVEELQIKRRMDDVVLVLFTSGTTSMPKGVPHTNRSWSSCFLGFSEGSRIDTDSIGCSHLPLFHIFGLYYWTSFNAVGATSVQPAAAYAARSTIQAIATERVSHVPGVPAMVQGIIQHPEFKNTDNSCVDVIVMGGTTILPKHIEMAKSFGKQTKGYEGFGTTESGVGWVHAPGTMPEDPHPNPNNLIRVCDEAGNVVPRGTEGELHHGGPQVIHEYWLGADHDKSQNDVFYDDKQGHWLRTGDKAIMADSGEVTVVGRYKDMIIRGGENISPSAIEQILAAEFDLVSEVVSAPDEVAGEVPVAIIQNDANANSSEIRGALSKKLGPMYTLDSIVSLHELDMQAYPKTSSGKVQKNVLREKVAELRERKDSTSVHNGDNERTTSMLDVSTLTALWSKHLGISEDDLDAEKSISDLTDSLAIAQFSAFLHKNTGYSLELSEILDNPSIEQQVKLLESQGHTQGSKDHSQIIPKRSGPPTTEEMIYTGGNEETFARIKGASEQVLSSLGLSWEDVEDVIPMQPTLQSFLKKRRLQGNNHRHTWLCKGKSIDEAERALKKVLIHHNIMVSLAIQDNPTTALHLVVRPSEQLFSHCLRRLPNVKNKEELAKQCYNDPKLDWAAAPGPLFRATLSHVDDEECAGIVYSAQHATFDGVSMLAVLQDLDAALENPEISLLARVPYKAWAESYYNGSKSIAAQNSIQWQVRRLKGISQHKDSLFPEQRAPEWFKGSAEGWIQEDGTPGPARTEIDNGRSDGVIGFNGEVDIGDAQQLRKSHGIEIPQLVKGAVAILNTRRTKSSTALFGQYQAGRTWPFLPKWQAAMMPDAMLVDGPTVQSTAIKVDIDEEDSLLEFLTKLQEEQTALNSHCHAPTDQVHLRLNESDSEDGTVSAEVVRRQIFNWLPGGFGTGSGSLQLVQMLSRTDCGMLWNCKMSDQSTLQIHLSWDDAQLGKAEAEELVKEALELVSYLTTKDNWAKHIRDITLSTK